MLIQCPECGSEREVAADFPSRPFCSPQCKLLDLGHWLGEEHRVRVPVNQSSLSNELAAALEREGIALDALSPDDLPPDFAGDWAQDRIPEE